MLDSLHNNTQRVLDERAGNSAMIMTDKTYPEVLRQINVANKTYLGVVASPLLSQYNMKKKTFLIPRHRNSFLFHISLEPGATIVTAEATEHTRLQMKTVATSVKENETNILGRLPWGSSAPSKGLVKRILP